MLNGIEFQQVDRQKIRRLIEEALGDLQAQVIGHVDEVPGKRQVLESGGRPALAVEHGEDLFQCVQRMEIREQKNRSARSTSLAR